MTVTPFKTTCSAFGCKRYTRTIGENGVYLCPGHWPLVPKKLRALQRKTSRAAQRDPSAKNCRRAWRVWNKCVERANRNMFGI